AGGPRNWGPGFMPAVYQGTRLRGGAEPIPNLANPQGIDADRQRAKLEYLGRLNRRHAVQRPEQTELDARIQSYELAFRMQAGAKWDSHSALEKNHASLCRSMDKPVAGLLKDLKRRGLLEETLVIWGGEFGRTPMSEKGDGRDHNPYGFTMWMAGAGLPGGRT